MDILPIICIGINDEINLLHWNDFFLSSSTCCIFFLYAGKISESVIEVSMYIEETRNERKNRLNHRADVGDVFCHSLTRGKEISLAHIHKKRFLPSFSGHCRRRRRREIATLSFVILSEHRSSRERETQRKKEVELTPNEVCLLAKMYIHSLHTTHALLPINERGREK